MVTECVLGQRPSPLSASERREISPPIHIVCSVPDNITIYHGFSMAFSVLLQMFQIGFFMLRYSLVYSTQCLENSVNVRLVSFLGSAFKFGGLWDGRYSSSGSGFKVN